uniref:Putative secreted protein n=1 Tax=Anopheles darlingi TaxID=43151 RepID=A0A2M4D5D0_ANODA
MQSKMLFFILSASFRATVALSIVIVICNGYFPFFKDKMTRFYEAKSSFLTKTSISNPFGGHQNFGKSNLIFAFQITFILTA